MLKSLFFSFVFFKVYPHRHPSCVSGHKTSRQQPVCQRDRTGKGKDVETPQRYSTPPHHTTAFAPFVSEFIITVID